MKMQFRATRQSWLVGTPRCGVRSGQRADPTFPGHGKTEALRFPNSARSSGSAVIVVLVLLFIMTVLLTANTLALRRFKQSLQSIEHRQLKKYGAPARP
jgi:hypothetical protein